MFLEVVFLTSLDVGPVDGNIFVSVITAMDMEGSKGMDKLMKTSNVFSKSNYLISVHVQLLDNVEYLLFASSIL